MRKTYGNTWWGQQWLNALNQIDYSNRLPRGRSYANKGAARNIQINKNRISADVKGTRRTPYKVNITIPVFTAHAKARIIELITANPIFLSKLLNRELPNVLNEACRKQGIDIFPHSWNDLDGKCSCPDWAVPCKHMASVLYLIANEIDKNPFIVFELHDFDLFKGLEGIGYTAEGQKEILIRSLENLQTNYDPQEKPFEWNTELFTALDFSGIPDCREQLLTLLSEKPVFYPMGNFKAILKKGYTSISKKMIREARQEKEKTLSPIMDAAEDVEILLDGEGDFLSCKLRNNKGKSILSFKDIEDFIHWLQGVPQSRLEQLAPALQGLALSCHLAEKLAIQSACIPQLLRIGSKHYKVRWLPATLNEDVRNIYRKVKTLTPSHILFYKKGKDIQQSTESDEYPALLAVFLNYFIHSFHQLDFRLQENEVVRLFFNGSIESFQSFESREYPSAIQLWLSRFYIVEKEFVPVLQIEDLDGRFSVKITVEDKSQAIEAPISLATLFAHDKYNHVRLDVLRDLATLSDYFPQISRLIASSGKEELHFDSDEFVPILFKILPTVRLFGIKVLLPKALRKLIRPQLSMQLEGEEQGVVAKTSIISLENMMRFQWQVALGDQQMDPEEFLRQVKRLSGIVKLNDQYVYFDEKQIKSLIDKLENPPTLNGNQLLQVALTEEYEGAKVKLDQKARNILDQLLRGEGKELPIGLEATLRPYQLRGFEWLYKNSRLGFGSLIADDMGLGKTIQVIAALLKLKEDGEFKKQKGLIIVPTTLLTNWEKEIQKFAPSLKTHIYHGPNRTLDPLKEAELLITTYGVVRSEGAKLQKQKWLTVVIDEAQNIKNPTTAQTKAVKKIKAQVRIAMSGTPVENRLSEYWSIFDFSNKGYLGSLNKFKNNFARPIEVDRDQKQLDRFRKITEPFILRRLKTDKSIIQDLPDKIEKDQYCSLSPDQAALYQNVLDNTMKTIEESDGISRRGLVLKLITALKQVCNHPRHFLKKGKKDPMLSGKTQLLLNLLTQTLDNGEKSLIFTQYQEMGKLLVDILETEFGIEAPFLHGGVSRKKRDEMVEDFQNNRTTRIMLLSLKAGGTGLNLTAASNVVHYDLWWNPAVEIQATDRAYRIGQTRNVMVHRFITKSTFEEKINKLLINKRELADLTVTSGEKWIGELSNSELKEMVELGN